MMKKIFILLLVLISYLGLHGQNQELVTSNSDVIGLTSFPTAPMLVQAGPENFYWIGGSPQGTTVEHPLLNDKVVNDYSNIYFIKYDKLGNPLASAAISGTYTIPSAFSLDGGLTLVGTAYEDVVANGNTLPLNAADRLEFIAKYNDLCQFERIIPIWDLDPSQYPNSRATMNPETGELYLTGKSNQSLNLLGHGILGKEWGDYLYVLRYDRDLALTGVFTAGFVEQDTLSGYYQDIRATPDGRDGVLITGTWQGDRTPIIDGEMLSKLTNSQGVFAFKLDGGFQKEWVLEGSLQGTDYDAFSGISEGMGLSNGDFVMMGATSTGHFSLGEVKIDFENGAGFNNMFAFRISPTGSVRWVRLLENRDEAYDVKKKGTDSEEFSANINRDAIYWKEEVLYLSGKFSGDLFEVAGRPLENKMGKGAFVAAISMRTGEELWGYALSSTRMELNGFDLDASGNVTLMGKTGSVQEYEGFGSVSMDGTDLVFHLGLNNQGDPLWRNNAYTSNLGYNNYGSDLEVLKDGEVFSTLYKSVPDPLLIGGASLTAKELYSTILVGLNADNALGGKITDKSGNPLNSGVVKAYKITNIGAYPLVQVVDIDDSGSYLFTGLIPGNYAFRVIPDRIAYPDGMPTYSGGGITWGATQTEAYDVAADTRATFLNISLSHLDPLTELDGSGKMSGNISYADDFIAKGTLARPVTQTSVILKKKASSKGTQEDDIVAYIETDEFGEYYFNFVPDGEYNMIVDIPGLPMSDNYDVEIIDNTLVGELDFVVENDGIYKPGSTGVETMEINLVSIFPNPGNGNLQMELRFSGDYRVRVFNSVGMMVKNRSYLSVSGIVDLDLSDKQSGIYLIMIEGDKGSETLKYIRE